MCFGSLLKRHFQKLEQIEGSPSPYIFILALFPALFSDKPSKLVHVLDLWGSGQRMEKNIY